MTDQTANLILEHLTALRNELASFKAEVHADLHDLKERVTSMEECQAEICLRVRPRTDPVQKFNLSEV